MALIIKCRSCRRRNLEAAPSCPFCAGTSFQFTVDFWPRGRNGSRKRIILPEKIVSIEEAAELEHNYVMLAQHRRRVSIPTPAVSTVDDLFDDYLRWYHTHRAVSTWHDVSKAWENDLKSFFGEYSVRSLTTDHYTLYQQVRSKEVKNRTVNKELDYFSGFLRWCRRDKKMDLARIEYDKLPTTRPIPMVLSPDEISRILAQAAAEPVYHALFLLLYSLGLRSAEARNLRWKDIDAGNQSLQVLQKGGDWKVLPMNTQVAAALEVLKKHPKKHTTSPYVFCVRKSGKQIQNVRKAIIRICARAGVTKDVHPHLFRHSVATHLLGAQVNLKTIQELLGHAQVSTTAKLYTQVGMNDLRNAQKAVDVYGKNE